MSGRTEVHGVKPDSLKPCVLTSDLTWVWAGAWSSYLPLNSFLVFLFFLFSFFFFDWTSEASLEFLGISFGDG